MVLKFLNLAHDVSFVVSFVLQKKRFETSNGINMALEKKQFPLHSARSCSVRITCRCVSCLDQFQVNCPWRCCISSPE